jgi:hypothetical protein
LLSGVVETVKRVEELLFRSSTAGKELNIVDQQEIKAPISITKLHRRSGTDGLDHLVHERLGADIVNPRFRILLPERQSDGLHQVGFAQPHPAVDEERVVDMTRGLARLARSVCWFITLPTTNVEAEARIELICQQKLAASQPEKAFPGETLEIAGRLSIIV